MKTMKDKKTRSILTSKVISFRSANYSRLILYSIGFTTGFILIGLSFILKDNWINVSSSVGTGLLTSLTVSVSINYEVDRQRKSKLLEDKKVVLSDIIAACINIYGNLVYRINEYIVFGDIPLKPFYAFYDNFEQYDEFDVILKSIDIYKLSASNSEHLETLLKIGEYHVNYLIVELKRLSKHEYYLRGLLTKDEFNGLTSNLADDTYIKYANDINDFWSNGIINYERCVHFLRMTLFITSKIISSFQYCRADVIEKERNIKDNLAQRYFDEIYSQSDEYIEKQLDEAQVREEYAETHSKKNGTGH